jgi:hypothetical protein
MTVRIEHESPSHLAEYAQVPIAFDVDETLRTPGLHARQCIDSRIPNVPTRCSSSGTGTSGLSSRRPDEAMMLRRRVANRVGAGNRDVRQ